MRREKLVCFLLLLITMVAKSQMIGDLSKKQQATFELFYFLPNVEKKLNEEVSLPANFKTNRLYDITFYLDSLGYISNIRYRKNEYNIDIVAIPLIKLLKEYQPYKVNYINEENKIKKINAIFITISFSGDGKIELSGC